MGNHSKKEWLQWQLTETQHLLKMSSDSLLMKMSLENRIEDIKAQIDELKNLNPFEPKVTLLFAGSAVVGSIGIKSSFASRTMNSIQGLIKTQSVLNMYGEEVIGRRGKLLKNNIGEMFLTGLPQGSFGFELSLMNSEDMFASDEVGQSIKDVMEIIRATAKDQEKYEKLIETHPARMFTYLKVFFKELMTEQSILKMESGNQYLELNAYDSKTAYDRANSTICNEKTINILGVFKGAFVESGKFEFLDEDENLQHGRIGEDIDEDAIVKYNKDFSNENCLMMIKERNVTFNNGRSKTSYELLNIRHQ